MSARFPIFNQLGKLRNVILFLLLLLPVLAQEKRGLDGIPIKSLVALSDHYLSPLGETALAMDASSWQHAETENFIYHFQSASSATQVALEAEFYYRVISADLGKDRSGWQRKAHIFIFEHPSQWVHFQSMGGLEPWTGGLNTGNELFLLRDATERWKGRTLGHEIAHLVINRFYPGLIPRWLNEGFAENVSRRAYAAFFRARGYAARPVSELVKSDDFLPLETLLNLQSYPLAEQDVVTFYTESDRLVRFLMDHGKDKFLVFLAALASGATTTSALSSAYGSEFSSIADLESKFRIFAAKNYTSQLVNGGG